MPREHSQVGPEVACERQESFCNRATCSVLFTVHASAAVDFAASVCLGLWPHHSIWGRLCL